MSATFAAVLLRHSLLGCSCLVTRAVTLGPRRQCGATTSELCPKLRLQPHGWTLALMLSFWVLAQKMLVWRPHIQVHLTIHHSGLHWQEFHRLTPKSCTTLNPSPESRVHFLYEEFIQPLFRESVSHTSTGSLPWTTHWFRAGDVTSHEVWN